MFATCCRHIEIEQKMTEPSENRSWKMLTWTNANYITSDLITSKRKKSIINIRKKLLNLNLRNISGVQESNGLLTLFVFS